MTLSYITSAVIHLDTGGHAECTPTHTHISTQVSTSLHRKTCARSHTKNETKVKCTDVAAARLQPVFFFVFLAAFSVLYVPQISSINSECAERADI